MPFIDDLERELHRLAAARERKPRRRWSMSLALVPATGLAAVVAAVIISGALTSPPDREEPAREGRPGNVPRLTGTYETTVSRSGEFNGRWELLIRDGSARLLGVLGGASESLSAGKMTFRGDEVTFRVPYTNDPFPGPLCERQRRDTPGTYRILVRPDGSFTLRRLRDPCRGRAAILTADVWRRPEAEG